jgi:hypothetical protein
MTWCGPRLRAGTSVVKAAGDVLARIKANKSR